MTPLPAPADDGSGRSADPASDMTQRAANSVGATAAPAESPGPDCCTRDDLDVYIAEVIDNAPPLTSEQRDKLALILRRNPGALAAKAARTARLAKGNFGRQQVNKARRNSKDRRTRDLLVSSSAVRGPETIGPLSQRRGCLAPRPGGGVSSVW